MFVYNLMHKSKYNVVSNEEKYWSWNEIEGKQITGNKNVKKIQNLDSVKKCLLLEEPESFLLYMYYHFDAES